MFKFYSAGTYLFNYKLSACAMPICIAGEIEKEPKYSVENLAANKKPQISTEFSKTSLSTIEVYL